MGTVRPDQVPALLPQPTGLPVAVVAVQVLQPAQVQAEPVAAVQAAQQIMLVRLAQQILARAVAAAHITHKLD